MCRVTHGSNGEVARKARGMRGVSGAGRSVRGQRGSGRGRRSRGGGGAAAPVGMFTATGTCLSRAKLASQFKLRFKWNWGVGGGRKKLPCGRSRRIKTCGCPRSSQQKREIWGFAQVLGFMVGAGVTAAMTRQRPAQTGGTGTDKPQTLCLPSLCIPLLLCCSDGFKNNWECPRGLRLWDKSDPPAAREKITKYPWLKIIP